MMLELLYVLSSSLGVSADKVRYALLLWLSYPLAIIFRHVLHYSWTSYFLRHIYLGGLGILFSICCFGWQTIYLLGVATASYLFLLVIPVGRVHWFTFSFCIAGMSAAHTYTLLTDYQGWSLDFTGPFMVMVQRIMYVGFSYHDGRARRKEDLTEDQEVNKILTLPSFLVYLCYCFNFLSFLTGPTTTYSEYTEMVTGQNFKKFGSGEPSCLDPVLQKFSLAMLLMAIFVYIDMSYDYKSFVLDDSLPFYLRFLYITLFSFYIRCRYYFAFLTAESVCNTAGFGFAGYDTSGQSNWDLTQTVDVFGSEFPSSSKVLAISWNTFTAKWLRRCVYERVGSYPTAMTFLVSSIWHGFYLRYYHCFLIFGLTTMAARKMRGLLRHRFQSSRGLSIFYDVLTTFSTIVLRDYAEMIFILLSYSQSWKLASYYYHLPIIIPALVLLLVPSRRRLADKHSKES